jgi:hypothetical protein
MARGKDLAGLAALGALGMMLSKGKKTVVEEPGEINERMDRANAISRGRTNLVDTGMSEKEPAENFSRRDAGMFEKEPDENYRNSGRRTGPVGVGKAPARTAPRRPRLDTSGVTDVDLTGGARSSGFDYGPNRNSYDNPIDTGPAGSTYKKGGAVKKMASGGMTSSASKRADGIAQKGKTRGKVC